MPIESSEKLRLFQFIVGEPMGGAERFFVKLAIALHERGIQQQLVIGADDARYAELKDAGLSVEQGHFQNWMQNWKSRIQLRRLLKKFRPNVCLAWMNRAARRLPPGPYARVARFGGYYPLRFYRNFDHIICNTPGLVQHVEESGWPASHASMISNFGELPKKSPVSRSDLNTPKDAFVIFSAGRFHPSKGFDTLIKALPDKSSVVLWLAGDGEEMQSLTKLSHDLGVTDQVRFLGWRSDSSSLFRAADLCVVPSRHEPLSNVIVEAWSESCPVLATASEGPRWLLEDGRSGRLVPIDDVLALRESIMGLEHDRAGLKQLSVDGHKKWRAQFSKQAVVDQYVELLTSLARQSKGI